MTAGPLMHCHICMVMYGYVWLCMVWYTIDVFVCGPVTCAVIDILLNAELQLHIGCVLAQRFHSHPCAIDCARVGPDKSTTTAAIVPTRPMGTTNQPDQPSQSQRCPCVGSIGWEDHAHNKLACPRSNRGLWALYMDLPHIVRQAPIIATTIR
jgi:hypothetical protein